MSIRNADLRAKLEHALAKPLADRGEGPHSEQFDPWQDIIVGVHGSYAAEADQLMIDALIAVRDRSTFDFIEQAGFAGELTLYILSGNGLLDYGTSPRGGFWDSDFDGLLQPLIDKWTAYAERIWVDSEAA